MWDQGEGEWEIIKKGTPRFEGHYQPKQPLWGYEPDNDPQVVERWIQTALAHGVNTFVYDCDEVYCVWQNCLNDDDSVDISLDIFECDGGAYYRSSEDFTERAYRIEDYKKWLSDAEFEILHIFDEMSDRELNETTERAVFVARYTGFKQPQKQQAAETEDL